MLFSCHAGLGTPDGRKLVCTAPAGAQAQDTQGSGGGQIGTGSVPTPGEPGFTANTGQGQG